MAGKLDVYVSIHLYLGGFGTDELAPVKHICVDSQMEKAIALKKNLMLSKMKLTNIFI